MFEFYLLTILSVAGSYWSLPHTIRKLRESRQVVFDMYKDNKIEVPTNAGIILLFISFLSISIVPVISLLLNKLSILDIQVQYYNESHLAFLLVVTIYSIYGLVDDIVDVGRFLKFTFPICFSFPLVVVCNPDYILVPFYGEFNLTGNLFFDISYNDLFRIFIIPIYVMVIANLVNMHSGYNGLQSGLSTILLITILLESWQDDQLDLVFPAGAFLGTMLCFYYFNKYPSKVFEGNIGALMFGSILGSLIVLQSYWWFGFFIFIPHIFNFLLWIYWIYMMRKDPLNYVKTDGKHSKFGRLAPDGCISVPNRLTLKWIPNYYYRLSEPHSVYIMYFVTSLFCITGVIIF